MKPSTTSKRDMIQISFLLFICVTCSAQATVSSNDAYGPQQLVDDKLKIQLVLAIDNQVGADQVNVNEFQEKKQLPIRGAISRALINGNHATYVEPPANFKPIIYNVDPKQASNFLIDLIEKQSDNEERPSSGQQEGGSDNGSSIVSASSDSKHNILFDSPLSHGQQLKPSVERWSEWYDMSIEPDLASSDTSASSPVLSMKLADKEDQMVADNLAIESTSVVSNKTYKTSQNQPALDQPVNKTMHASSKTNRSGIVDFTKTLEGASKQKSLTEEAALISKKSLKVGQMATPVVNYSSLVGASNKQVVSAMKSARNREQAYGLTGKLLLSNLSGLSTKSELPNRLQIKGGHQASNLSDPSSLQVAALSADDATSPSKTGTHATLNHTPLLSPAQRLVLVGATGQQVASEFSSSQRPRAAYLQWKIIVHDSSRSLNGKSNSSSSSLFPSAYLMNKQEQLHKQSSARRMKRRRKSKSNAEVRIQQLVAASQLKQQQQLILSNANQVNDFSPSQQHARGQLLATTGERVLKALGSQQKIAGMQVKRFHAPITKNNSSTTKRTFRRRKLKTLLPVGLSSWFLGGIRDLDGRHWQMPSELLNKLAVNDVDFHPNSKPKGGLAGENSADIFLFSSNSAKEFEGPPSTSASNELKQAQQVLTAQAKASALDPPPR